MIQLLKQKINLYQRSQAYAPALSAVRIVQCWLALLIFLMMVAFTHKLNLTRYQNAIEALKISQAKDSEDLLELSQVKKGKNIIKSKNEVALLKERISDVDSIVAQLKHIEAEERYPFSFYVESLATRHVKGTYLAYINLQDEGRKMSFAGVALEPQLVPIMVQSWQRSPSIISTQVKKVRLDNLKQDKDFVKFNLQAE